MNKDRLEKISCDWNGRSCSQLVAEEINARQGVGGKRCRYLGVLNSGQACEGACRLKDYVVEEKERVAEFRRQLASGEIVLRD